MRADHTGQGTRATKRTKQLSPILAEFQDNARNNHYDYALFHAMCVLGVEVYYIQNPQTGERRLVNQADYQVMVGGASIDDANDAVKAQASGGLGSLFQSQPSKQQQQQQHTNWDIALPKCEIATPADRGKWQPVTQLPSGKTLPNGQVHDGRSLLTLHQTRAKDIGLSQATVGSGAQLRQYLKAGAMTRVGQTWSEKLAAFLSNSVVRGILVVVLLVGGYLEFQSPGLGVPGAVAALALVALLGAPFVVGLAEIWHVVVFCIGLILLICELTFIPGFGFVGVTGLGMMFIGLMLMIVPSNAGPAGWKVLPGVQMWDRVVESGLFLMVGLCAGLVGIYMIARYFGNLPLLNRLVLQSEQRPAMAGAGIVGAGRRGRAFPRQWR